MRKVQVVALKGEIKHDSARDAEKVTVTECREQTKYRDWSLSERMPHGESRIKFVSTHE